MASNQEVGSIPRQSFRKPKYGKQEEQRDGMGHHDVKRKINSSNQEDRQLELLISRDGPHHQLPNYQYLSPFLEFA